MPTYIIDENIPATISIWNNKKFIHVLEISNSFSDTDLWQYAQSNNLVIITKDTDFYNRYLSSKNSPKIILIKTGNLKKTYLKLLLKTFGTMLKLCLNKVHLLLLMKKKLKACNYENFFNRLYGLRKKLLGQ